MQTDPVQQLKSQDETLRSLNRLLRGELAAAATYENALGHIRRPDCRTVLEQNRASHVSRAVLLGQQITRHGGKPATTAGAWGTLAKLFESGAAMIGERALLRTLREGEAAGLETYIGDLKTIDPAIADVLYEHALPEQQLTLTRLDQLLLDFENGD